MRCQISTSPRNTTQIAMKVIIALSARRRPRFTETRGVGWRSAIGSAVVERDEREPEHVERRAWVARGIERVRDGQAIHERDYRLGDERRGHARRERKA